jgi:hypothetical protein
MLFDAGMVEDITESSYYVNLISALTLAGSRLMYAPSLT